MGNLTLDVDAGAVYCQFTADSVYFNVEKTVTEIDEEGKILQDFALLINLCYRFLHVEIYAIGGELAIDSPRIYV